MDEHEPRRLRPRRAQEEEGTRNRLKRYADSVRDVQPLIEAAGIALGTLGILFLVIQSYLMYESNGLTRLSLKATAESLEITQRARLGIYDLTPVPLDRVLKDDLQVRIRNSGSVPATGAKVFALLITAKKGRAFPRPSESELYRVLAVVHPGMEESLSVSKCSCSTADEQEILTEGAEVWVVGGIDYQDGFGHQRRTRFCRIHQPGGLSWKPCDSGNVAD